MNCAELARISNHSLAAPRSLSRLTLFCFSCSLYVNS